MKYKKVALVGMMGSGKTTVARELSFLTKARLLDLDSIFEKKYQISISDFFKKFSEKKFREFETELLKEAISIDSFILSTGGGIVLSKENRDILFGSNICSIYLSAGVDEIYNRIKDDKNRPLLQVKNPKCEIEKILNNRIEYYKMAKYEIKTDNKTIEEIIEEIKWIV